MNFEGDHLVFKRIKYPKFCIKKVSLNLYLHKISFESSQPTPIGICSQLYTACVCCSYIERAPRGETTRRSLITSLIELT